MAENVDAAASGRGKRDRKQTTFFETTAEEMPKKASKVDKQKDGMGMPLAENEVFCSEVQKYVGDSELLKALHMMFYGTPGKKLEVKKNLRLFSGFSGDVNVQEKVNKVMEKKKVWTVTNLKKALALFGLERGGDRDVLVRRMVEYIAAPCLPQVTGRASKPSSKKSKKSTKSGKKSGGKKSKTKRISAPSAYMLFAQATREQVSSEMPEATFGEISKAVGARWKELSEKERKPWETAAAARKAELGLSSAAGGAADTADVSEESDAEDGGDDGAEDDFDED